MSESTSQSQLQQRWDAAFMHCFGTPKRVFVSGEGAELVDADGNKYHDLFSGIAVGALGHAHPAVIEAVTNQLATLGHISNLFASVPQIELAEALLQLVRGYGCTAPANCYFANSGTEANETACKLTRLTGRTKVIAMEGSFHGRTMGALALTSTEKYRKPFEPLPGEVVFVPYGDEKALADAIDDQTAAVVLETIQGESGVVPAPAGYLAKVRGLCDQNGALLWVDEVQTGMGRCGEWFTSLASGVQPDLITLAKGIGNGIPLAACLAIGPAAKLFTPGSHGSTFGGNPVAAAAGLAVIKTITEHDLLAKCQQKGKSFRKELENFDHPLISQVRGQGLLIGIQLAKPVANEVADQALAAGWIINAARPDVLRLAPPLIIDQTVLTEFCKVLADILDGVVNE